MIGGLGVDIVEIERMALALARTPRMKERIFSAEEIAYCESRSRPEVHFALRFAAKEAVLKALGTGFSGVRFKDVEVARDDRGRPVPVLHGRAVELAEEAGVREFHLSLSYTATTAVASAVAIIGDVVPPQVPEPTPREQVAAMFKASRGLLDEIEPGQGDAGEEGGRLGPDAGEATDPARGTAPSAPEPGDAGESTGA